MLLFYCYRDHRDLHSFPTRRSSDLTGSARRAARGRPSSTGSASVATYNACPLHCRPSTACCAWVLRSEEHTSELQSLRHLVCRLLLEKKKKNKNKITSYKNKNK